MQLIMMTSRGNKSIGLTYNWTQGFKAVPRLTNAGKSGQDNKVHDKYKVQKEAKKVTRALELSLYI